ncbi:DNL-type domain-containing protein [[Candida] zeylanoides]
MRLETAIARLAIRAGAGTRRAAPGAACLRVPWRAAARPFGASLAAARLAAATRRYSNAPDASTASFKTTPPQMMIAFTCKKCDTRSSHVFSKQAYQTGTVLIQCPGCKNRHLIADSLKIFDDKSINLEDILRAKGESVATDTEDLVFEDIPASLRDRLGHHAKDAPAEYRTRAAEPGAAEPKSNVLPEAEVTPAKSK